MLAGRPSVRALVAKLVKNKARFTSTLPLVLIYELLLGQWKEEEEEGKECSKDDANKRNKLRLVLQKEVALLNERGVSAQSLVEQQTTASAALLPRYVRVNTMHCSFSSVIEQLQLDGWRIRRLKKGITPKNYRKLVMKLAPPRVYVDPHIDDLLIFPRAVDLHDCKLARQGCLFLQDKASCLSAFVLQPEPGSVAMDVCAAPGMKTTHLAALMQNRGKIWAFDRDRKRSELLRQMVNKSNTSIVSVECKDFLRVDVLDEQFKKVEFVIVDPPCSGSGMVKRGEYFDEFEAPDMQRIQSLANLQVMLLKHALRLPSLRRLVYSTCSVHWTENEGVVLEILSDPRLSLLFQLVDASPKWRHRGKIGESAEAELKKCLRASPERDLTNGFFVALFERIDKKG